MKSSRKKLLGLAILLVFLAALGMAGRKIYREARQPELNRALIAAVKKNDTADVMVLLSEGADPNARNLPPDPRSMWLRLWDRIRGKPLPTGDGPTALLVALAANANRAFPPENVPLVKALLDAGASVKVRDDRNTTLLMLAAMASKRSTAQLLLDHGAFVNESDISGCTALYYAANEKDPALVQLLLVRGARVDTTDAFSETPIYRAVDGGQADIIRLLLRNGAQVDARDRDRSTPLCEAIEFGEVGQIECVKLLLANGANVNTRDVRGNTPLSLAQEHDKAQIVRLLKKAGANE